MTLAAWMGALGIGVTLGLLGSGGSIVTVPILVYLVHQPDKVAIATSLAIVGSIALTGGLAAALQRRVDWLTVLQFSVPGMAGAWAGAWVATLVAGRTQLLVFAVVMLLAAVFMWRPRPACSEAPPAAGGARHLLVAAQGAGLGVLTGFVGVGGGFLIVPVLVLLARLPIHRAVGTSLLIIALNSFVALWRSETALLAAHVTLDWPLIARFIAVGIAGSIVGLQAGVHIPQHRLQRGFAVFLVAAGLLILWTRLPALPA